MPKYLVTWMGVVTGSLAGRDDGYPEEKQAIVEEHNLWKHANRPDVAFYKIARCDVSALIAQQRLNNAEKEAQDKRDRDAAYRKLSPREKQLLGVRK